MTDIDLDTLEGIALMADRGGRPWDVQVVGDKGYPQRIYRRGDMALIAECYDGPQYPPTGPDHIAAFDPPTALELIRRLRAVEQLASDWDANGNSRPLGDPTADTWHTAARQIRRAVRGEP